MNKNYNNHGKSLMSYNDKVEYVGTSNLKALLLVALPLLPIVAVIITHLPK